MFQGFCELADTFLGVFQVKNSSGVPIDADATPTARVYGPDGYLLNATVALLDSKSITTASNAAPVSVVSTAHGLTTGARITVIGVTGNSGALGTTTITFVDSNTFTLDGTTGSGSGTGGSWHLTGAYSFSVLANGANGFESGENYFVVEQWAVSSTAGANADSFQVA